LRILHLIDSGGLYGAENMLLSLAEKQKELGHNPVIGSIRKPGITIKPIESEALSRGIDLHTFDFKPGLNIFASIQILKYARTNKFDILHSHGYKTNILLGLIPSFIRKIPIVTTLHGWTNIGGITKMRLNEELDAIALKFIDKVILVSPGMLEKVKNKRVPSKNISIINNGIDINIDEFSSFKKDQLVDICITDSNLNMRIKSFLDNSISIASIGRLSHEKGYSTLIDALRILHEKHNHKIKLLLVGEGRHRSILEKHAVDTGLSEYILMTGYIKNAYQLLPLVDYYVISSLTEGLPITLLEAMTLKIPIVATEVGGIPNVLEHEKDSLLIPPNDPHAIANSIKRLIDNPNLSSRLSTEARKKVIENYSSKAMASSYLEVYSEVIDK
jgi:glycosyltransferase involved in cell wall biosynthesis